VLGYVAAALLVLAVVTWAALSPQSRDELGDALAGQAATFVVGGVVAAAGLAVLLLRGPGAYPVRTRRMTADVRLLLGANAGHRIEPSGPPELAELAVAVNALAERRQDVEREVERETAAARADVESERNRLAALMADLSVAVLVCSRGGRVLLYNPAARALLGDDPGLGLGRSVFGLLDRDLVTHALDRVADGTGAHVSTVLRDGDLLTVRLSPVRDDDGQVGGFVVVLEDTRHLQEQRRRDAELRTLTEQTRASLAAVRAAVETALDYPDMAPEERTGFLEIVREESERLGRKVEAWAAASAGTSGWLLPDMAGDDLLALLRRELERAGLTVAPLLPASPWVRLDSHALARAVTQLAGRVREHAAVERFALSLEGAGEHVRLDLRWTGPVPDQDAFTGWLEEPLAGGIAAHVREVLERHDAEVWTATDGDGALVRLLLPSATPSEGAPSRPPVPLVVGSRPEFYDFDLFDLPEQAAGWHDRRLAELAFTVFDTETTGFTPEAGDEIVALGAVRVVGGRLRAHETFERLVDPRRAVPETSTAVHGITTEMVRGQPRIQDVLPQFARFAEETVLVGHNVAFDLAFLRAAERRTGVRLEQPALDTLLLDAALHPDHPSHSLETVAERLGVDVVGRHTALGDALVTGEVLVRLVGLLRQRGIETLGEALEASRATFRARQDAASRTR
jgi:DNA polymerase III subunit epsilon